MLVDAPRTGLEESAGELYNPGERQRVWVVGKCNARKMLLHRSAIQTQPQR